jgi:hypothetical protein
MDGTSPMRQTVIAAMTARAGANPESARTLAAELEQRTYERRSDDDLFDLAGRVGVPVERLAKIGLLSRERAPEHATVICVRCQDTGSYDRGDGRFVRCHVCNPEPPQEES